MAQRTGGWPGSSRQTRHLLGTAPFRLTRHPSAVSVPLLAPCPDGFALAFWSGRLGFDPPNTWWKRATASLLSGGGITAAYGARVTVDLIRGYPVTVNDADFAGFVLDMTRRPFAPDTRLQARTRDRHGHARHVGAASYRTRAVSAPRALGFSAPARTSRLGTFTAVMWFCTSAALVLPGLSIRERKGVVR